jgi:hypothetical protein
MFVLLDITKITQQQRNVQFVPMVNSKILKEIAVALYVLQESFKIRKEAQYVWSVTLENVKMNMEEPHVNLVHLGPTSLRQTKAVVPHACQGVFLGLHH